MKPKTITLTKERLIELKDFQFSKGYRLAEAKERERILRLIKQHIILQNLTKFEWYKETSNVLRNLKSEIKGESK